MSESIDTAKSMSTLIDHAPNHSRARAIPMPAKSLSALLVALASTASASLKPTNATAATPALKTDLSISLSPKKTYLNAGHLASCTELNTSSYPPGDSGDTNQDGPYDLQVRRDHGHVDPESTQTKGAFRFPKFTFDFTGRTEFRLSYAIVAVHLPDNDYEASLSDSELEALLALPGLTVTGPTHIVSNDPSDPRRQRPNNYVPCGLIINEVPLSDTTRAFTAPVEVRLTGYRKMADGQESAEEITTEGEVEYTP